MNPAGKCQTLGPEILHPKQAPLLLNVNPWGKGAGYEAVGLAACVCQVERPSLAGGPWVLATAALAGLGEGFGFYRGSRPGERPGARIQNKAAFITPGPAAASHDIMASAETLVLTRGTDGSGAAAS